MTDQQRNAQIATYSRERLSPTTTQRTNISSRYEELKGFLGGSCFMSGSYARFTAVRPPKDLDVIWVYGDGLLTREPRRFLDSLTTTLSDAYRLHSSDRVKFEVQDHSITILFLDDPNGFSIDVVPAVEAGIVNEFGFPIYCVPEIQKLSHRRRRTFTGDASWIYSDPKGYVIEASSLEKRTAGRFRKAAKIVKAWRQKHKKEHGDAFKLKSFHVEQLVNRHLQRRPDDTILQVLRAVFNCLNDAIDEPAIPDRANPLIFIDQYVSSLTSAERAKILTLQREASMIVAGIEAAQSDAHIDDLMDRLTQVSERTPIASVPAVLIKTPPQPYAMKIR